MTDAGRPEPLVLTQITDGTGYITFNRTSRMNAFNLELAEQFIAAVERLSRDEGVRALVVRGAGKVFSAGGDVREMHEDVARGEPAAYFGAPLAAFGRMALAARKAGKPVLASVHGAVAGVAFNLMLSCDLRIAAQGTRFTQAFVRLGLCPDGGGTFHLPRMIGHARACELTMLPTEIDADTALAWGLINWVVPAEVLEEKTREIARKLAEGPTATLARIKALLNGDNDDALAARMEAERLAQVENAATSDFSEGLSAFIQKRKPVFRGR